MPNKSLKTKRFSVMKLVWVQHIVMDLTCIIMHVRHYAYGETVAQEVEWLSWDRKVPGSIPGSSWAKCRSVLEQDNESLTAPGGQVGALHGFLCHRCMNG